MQKVRRAAESKFLVAVVSAALSVLGTSLATAYPDIYAAVCQGGAQWTQQ